jgi:hypothetical protein
MLCRMCHLSRVLKTRNLRHAHVLWIMHPLTSQSCAPASSSWGRLMVLLGVALTWWDKRAKALVHYGNPWNLYVLGNTPGSCQCLIPRSSVPMLHEPLKVLIFQLPNYVSHGSLYPERNLNGLPEGLQFCHWTPGTHHPIKGLPFNFWIS